MAVRPRNRLEEKLEGLTAAQMYAALANEKLLADGVTKADVIALARPILRAEENAPRHEIACALYEKLFLSARGMALIPQYVRAEVARRPRIPQPPAPWSPWTAAELYESLARAEWLDPKAREKKLRAFIARARERAIARGPSEEGMREIVLRALYEAAYLSEAADREVAAWGFAGVSKRWKRRLGRLIAGDPRT